MAAAKPQTRGPPPYPIKYEVEQQDDLEDELDEDDERTARLLTPQVTLDVAQRRKPFLQNRDYVEQDDAYDGLESGYEMDYIYMSDNSQDLKVERLPPRNRSNGNKRPASVEGGSNAGGRAKKMYELDVTLYPEAAAARASYENRLRKKAEKEQMINQLNFLTERNKLLEEENQVLKEKLLEYEMNVTSQDWYLFFRSAGIRTGHDRKYASIFDENRIKPNMLLDLNEQWLRDMEITAVGDILSILKHAKIVHSKTNGRRLHFGSQSLLQRCTSPMKKSLESQSPSNDRILITSICSLNE